MHASSKGWLKRGLLNMSVFTIDKTLHVLTHRKSVSNERSIAPHDQEASCKCDAKKEGCSIQKSSKS
jgi:hypothetical protein